MSDTNSYEPNKPERDQGKSNVFLDLNKPEEATGIPAITPGFSSEQSSGSYELSQGSPEASKFNGQVILAGLVFAIGVGSIYTMRHIGMQAGINESVSLVEYTASTNTPDFIKRFEIIMADLEEVSISVQFAKDTELPSTPFTLAQVVIDDDGLSMPVSAGDDPEAAKARLEMLRAQMEQDERNVRESDYETIASGLSLQSVIGGTRPVARISGEPVGVGMMVAKTFKVLSIKGSIVILEVEGIKFKLGLGSGAKRIN
ncbi:MAG: hypothetical protein JKY43_08845 [Phycisphaerales bacterium]|nr:hypothetical protein [Phycisphaerales bacterium]